MKKHRRSKETLDKIEADYKLYGDAYISFRVEVNAFQTGKSSSQVSQPRS